MRCINRRNPVLASPRPILLGSSGCWCSRGSPKLTLTPMGKVMLVLDTFIKAFNHVVQENIKERETQAPNPVPNPNPNMKERETQARVANRWKKKVEDGKKKKAAAGGKEAPGASTKSVAEQFAAAATQKAAKASHREMIQDEEDSSPVSQGPTPQTTPQHTPQPTRPLHLLPRCLAGLGGAQASLYVP